MNDANDQMSWDDEDAYWRSNYRTRPYASSADRGYGHYQPGYQFGYDAANRYRNRNWNDVEADLSRDWNTYKNRGDSTWEQMKDAVRDAWDRIAGKRPLSAR